jgi:hypothetical protein
MRVMLVLTMVLAMLAPLWAKEISITWEWDRADDQVTAFRYQVNGQEPDAWIVVDGSVTRYSIGPVEDTQAFTLYVQQSYDGSNWSESGLMPYDPQEFGVAITPEATEPVKMVTVAGEPAIEVREPEPVLVAAEPVVEEVVEIESQPVAPAVQPAPEPVPAPVSPKLQRVELYVGAGGKADNYFPAGSFDPNGAFVNLRTMVLPSITLDYVRSSLMELGSSIDLGIRAGMGYTGYGTATTSIAGFDIHALALAEYDPQGPFSFDGGVGLAFMFTSNAIQGASTEIGVFFGPVAQIGANYRITDTWSAGVSAETRFLMANQFDPYELTGMIRFGLGYRF